MLSDDEIQKLIGEEFDKLRDFVLEKNKKYGSSAIYPKRIFSTANPIEQLKVRIDDKISRLTNLGYNNARDTAADLAGYLILLNVVEKIHGIESVKSEVDFDYDDGVTYDEFGNLKY